MMRRGDSMHVRPGPILALVAAALAVATPVRADPIRHPTAVFAGLDKTTGRIISFDVNIDETVQFRTLMITPRVCNTRPQTETPQTTSFVEVDEQMPKPDQRRDASGNARPESKSDAKPVVRRIFSGWMFASSPGLHGVEHPVYDVWLMDCKGGREATAATDATPANPAAATATSPATPATEAPRPSGKQRRTAAAPAAASDRPGGPDDPVFDPATTGDPGAAEPPKKKKKKHKKPAAAAPQGEPPPNPAGGVF